MTIFIHLDVASLTIARKKFNCDVNEMGDVV